MTPPLHRLLSLSQLDSAFLVAVVAGQVCPQYDSIFAILVDRDFHRETRNESRRDFYKLEEQAALDMLGRVNTELLPHRRNGRCDQQKVHYALKRP